MKGSAAAEAGGGADPARRLGAGGRAHAAVMGVVLAFSWFPVLVTRFPPLCDYPNHLARTYVLHHLGDVPAFGEAYRAEWHPYPNLAIDLVGRALLVVAGPELAGRLFLAVAAALVVLGADHLGRAIHGGPSWTAPLAGFLVWNGFSFYGFVNYFFGLGVFLFALAAWLRARAAPTAPRLLVAALAATGAYVAHLSAFAFLAVAAAVWVAVEPRGPRLRACVTGALPLLPPVALWLFGGVPRAPEPLRWDGLPGKGKGVAMLIATYDVATDVLLGLLMAAALAFALRAACSRSRPALVAAALLAVVFVVAPTEAQGGWSVDRRFLLPAALLGLVAFRIEKLDTVRLRLAVGLAVAVVVARDVVVTAAWRGLGADLERRVALLAAVPEGASVYGFARASGASTARTREMGLVSLHQYAVILRHAAASGLFVHENQQPLRARRPDVAAQPAAGQAPEDFDWAAVFARHDVVLASRLDEPYRRFLTARCRILADAGDAAVFDRCQSEDLGGASAPRAIGAAAQPGRKPAPP